MKPIVGLMPLYDAENDRIWMRRDYLDMLEACGAAPVILPLTKDPVELDRFLSACDAFLLTGGHDIDPARYGQDPLPECEAIAPGRDAMDLYIAYELATMRKPTLGICRGCQVMNVALGGSMWQDLPTQTATTLTHRMSKPYDAVAHEVTILPGTLLADILGDKTMGVNSVHHQGIHVVGEGLEVAAMASDGLVEAIVLPGHPFYLGVQWHPEMSFKTSEGSRKLAAAFVDAI